MKIGFVLVPGYALMSLASAVEPLRAANIWRERRSTVFPSIRTPEAS
jgi:transcriptional regulator GlxA family with amidase domain